MTSGRDQKELTGVSLLGNKTKYPTDYAPEVLDKPVPDDRTAGFCCDLYFLCA